MTATKRKVDERLPYTLENLKKTPAFQEAWVTVLEVFEQFRLNEAILLHLTRPLPRKGNPDDVLKAAAIDQWRQEGAIELFDMLVFGLLDSDDDETIEQTNDGEI